MNTGTQELKLKDNSHIESNTNPRSIPRIEPNSFLALLFLAIIGTAGIYYVNIIPALVGALVDSLGFTKQQAGYVSSANIYGAAAGAILSVFMVKRFPWKKIAISMLSLLIAIDLITPAFTSPYTLMAIRLIAGTVGGLIAGTTLGIIARTSQPDRGYGALLIIQFGLGGFGLLLLPSLVSAIGHQILFYALAGFSALALILVPLLSDYPIRSLNSHKSASPTDYTQKKGIAVKPLILILISIFLFQSANMGLFAYLERLGMFEQHSLQWVSFSLATGSWVGIPGSFLVVLLSTRFGRALPLAIGMATILVGIWLFHYAYNANIYLLANILLAFAWSFCLPYLFGMCAQLDHTGQMASVGGMTSKFGMASGPLVGATILMDNNYGILINTVFFTILITATIACFTARLIDRKEYQIG